MSKIIFSKKGFTGIVYLNNAKKSNAFDLSIVTELSELFKKIKKSGLKVIIMKGKGKNFCAGGDITWEKQIGRMDEKGARGQISFVQKTIANLEKLPQVTIAAIRGHAVGGGNELAMACDIRVASKNAKFTHPETSLGTIAPLGGTKRLPRLIGLGKAKYMLFTGDTISSETALRWGLIDFLTDESELDAFVDSLAFKISAKPAKSLELTKQSISKEYHKDLQDTFEAESYIKCSRTGENKEMLARLLKKIN